MPGNGEQARDGYRSFGAYLRSQRQLAQLTLRQLADLSSISNPYLSQIERGLHQPSVAVIRSIADALNLSADVLLAQVAGLDDTEVPDASITTESAIRADPRLSGAQKSALLSVYRSMVGHPIGADDNAGPDSGHNTTDNSAPTTGASNRDAGHAGDHAPPTVPGPRGRPGPGPGPHAATRTVLTSRRGLPPPHRPRHRHRAGVWGDTVSR